MSGTCTSKLLWYDYWVRAYTRVLFSPYMRTAKKQSTKQFIICVFFSAIFIVEMRVFALLVVNETRLNISAKKKRCSNRLANHSPLTQRLCNTIIITNVHAPIFVNHLNLNVYSGIELSWMNVYPFWEDTKMCNMFCRFD